MTLKKKLILLFTVLFTSIFITVLGQVPEIIRQARLSSSKAIASMVFIEQKSYRGEFGQYTPKANNITVTQENMPHIKIYQSVNGLPTKILQKLLPGDIPYVDKDNYIILIANFERDPTTLIRVDDTGAIKEIVLK